MYYLELIIVTFVMIFVTLMFLVRNKTETSWLNLYELSGVWFSFLLGLFCYLIKNQEINNIRSTFSLILLLIFTCFVISVLSETNNYYFLIFTSNLLLTITVLIASQIYYSRSVLGVATPIVLFIIQKLIFFGNQLFE